MSTFFANSLLEEGEELENRPDLIAMLEEGLLKLPSSVDNNSAATDAKESTTAISANADAPTSSTTSVISTATTSTTATTAQSEKQFHHSQQFLWEEAISWDQRGHGDSAVDGPSRRLDPCVENICGWLIRLRDCHRVHGTCC